MNREPLTVDELKKMSGNPVLIHVLEDGEKYWAIVDDVLEKGVTLLSTVIEDDYGAYEVYGESWVAYAMEGETKQKSNETELKRNGTTEPLVTNGDRISSMNDEELALWLCGIMSAECCDRSCPAREICGFCDNGLVKWMKQPSEEG